MFACATLSLAVSIGVPATAQPARPDFTGTWTLNLSRSDYGPFPAPARRIDVIDHRGPTLEVTRRETNSRGEERTGRWACTTDRLECTNTLGGNPLKTSVHWDGATLIGETKTIFQGQEAFIEDRWTLSADGRTLTIARHAVSPQGAVDQMFVFERAEK
jgi:hypothetical protein